MSRYVLDITVKGHDKASRPLGNVGKALGTLAKISFGAVAIGVAAIGVAVGKLAFNGVNAAAEMQNLELALETLAAKEMARGEEVIKTRSAIVHLTKKEKQELQELRLEYNTFGARMKEQQQRVHEMTTKWTDQGLATQTAKAKLAEMRHEYGEMGKEIDKLAGKEGKLVTVQEKVRVNTMELGEALKLATPKAKELMVKLRDLSIISPFEYQQVADTFRFNMAMGATADTAMDLTKAILDSGAAMGLSAEMMGRLNYNLGQALVAGDLTMANLRQLRMVGLDLAEVFEDELGLSIQQVRDQLKSGKLEMEDVSKAFMDYAERNFGGAAERMSKTFTGLKSSIKDLFFFAGADTLRPALEEVTKFLGGMFDQAREVMESGQLAEIGELIGDMVGALLEGDWQGVLGGMADAFGELGASEGLQDTVKALAPFFQALKELGEGDVDSAILNVAAGIGDMAEALFNVDAGTASDIALAVKEFGENAYEAAQGIAEFVTNAADTAWQEAMSWWTEHGDEVQAIVLKVGEGLAEAAKDVGEFAVALVETGWETRLEWFEEHGDEVSEAINDLGASFERIAGVFEGDTAVSMDEGLSMFERFSELQMDQALSSLQNLEDIVGGVAGALEWLKTAVVDILPAVSGLELTTGPLPDIFDRLGGIFERIATGNFMGLIADQAREMADAIGYLWDKISDIGLGGFLEQLGGEIAFEWERAMGQGEEKQEEGLDNWRALWEDGGAGGAGMIDLGPMVDEVETEMGRLPDAMGLPVEEAAKATVMALDDMYYTVVGHSIIPDMIDGIADEFERLPGAVQADLAALTSMVTKETAQLQAAITKMMADALKVVVGQVPEWEKAGRALVDGMQQGIDNRWPVLLTSIQFKIRDLVIVVLRELGILSPSRVFADIGENMVKGLERGWGGQFPAFDRQVLGNFGGLTTGAMMGGMAFAGGGAGGYPTPIVNVQAPGGGGDTINFYVQDQSSMALALAMVEDRRAGRLNASMGG